MIKLDENGKVVYTDPLEDVTDEVAEAEALPKTDAERITELENQVTDLQLALCDVYESTL